MTHVIIMIEYQKTMLKLLITALQALEKLYPYYKEIWINVGKYGALWPWPGNCYLQNTRPIRERKTLIPRRLRVHFHE